MRRRNVVKAVVLGAALALVVPGTAYASTTATVTTPGATTSVSPGNGAKLSTNATCASNLISSGGVNVTSSGTNTTQEKDAIHVMETEPGSNGSPASNGATNVTQWLGVAGTGGHGSGTYMVQPFGVCFTNSTITSTQVVLPSSTSGPNGIDSTATSTASCPTGTRLLGGGAQVTKASNQRVKVIASYPSDSSRQAASDASTNPTSWTAVALNGDMAGSGNTTAAYAICSGSSSSVTVTVKHAHVTGPTSASGSQPATTSACGAGEGNLISGGASISGGDPTGLGGFTAPGDGGDHLDGDYPSSNTLNPPTPTTNNSSTTYWTAIGHSGGTATPSTYTDAWGLCMN